MRSRTPNQLLDVRLHTMAMPGLSCVRTELFYLLILPPLAHHPERANRQFSRHGDFGDLRPRRIARSKYWFRHCGILRAVTWADSEPRSDCALFVGLSLLFVVLGVIR